MIQKVFVVGATGKVGSEVVEQIIHKGDTCQHRHTNPTLIVGLASQRGGYIYSKDGIGNSAALDFSKRKMAGKQFSDMTELIRVVGGDKTVFVDLTAGKQEMLDFHKAIIFKTENSIVTANKFPLTLCTFEEFKSLTSDYERYGFSASVNAGAGTVSWLRNCVDLNDQVTAIQGCFSGTLGFISTGLMKGKAFSKLFKEAVAKGYTEPNPIEDLRGADVERKAMIVARAAGIDVNEARVERWPFVEEQFLNFGSLERFVNFGTRDHFLDELDASIEERVKEEYKEGKVLRYVAAVYNSLPNMIVMPMYIDKTDGLGMLTGTANKVIITTEAYRDGWSLEAAGAGIEVTARNVRADLLDRLRGRKVKF